MDNTINLKIGICVFCMAVSIFQLACKNSVNDDSDGYARVEFAVNDTSAARTAMPRPVVLAEISSFTLTGVKADNGNSSVLEILETDETSTAYAKLEALSLMISPGKWVFSLAAKLDGEERYSASIEQDLQDGEQRLVFELQPVLKTGTVSISLKYPAAAGVTGVYAGLYNDPAGQELSDPVSLPRADITSSAKAIENTVQVTYQNSAVPPGSYYLHFVLYSGTSVQKVLNYYSVLIKVKTGFDTTGVFDMEDAVNDRYTISYYDTDSETFSYFIQDYTAPASYSLAEDVVLPSASVVKKDGYQFDGWYIIQNAMQISLSGWKANEYAGNMQVYAKWIPDSYSITLYDKRRDSNVETELAIVPVTSGELLPDIFIPKRAGYVFCGYYTEPVTGGVQYYDKSGIGKKWDLPSDTKLYAHWKVDRDNYDSKVAELADLMNKLADEVENAVTVCKEADARGVAITAEQYNYAEERINEGIDSLVSLGCDVCDILIADLEESIIDENDNTDSAERINANQSIKRNFELIKVNMHTGSRIIKKYAQGLQRYKFIEWGVLNSMKSIFCNSLNLDIYPYAENLFSDWYIAANKQLRDKLETTIYETIWNMESECFYFTY